MTSEQIKMKAREIAMQAREMPNWKAANTRANEAEDCGDLIAFEDAAIAQCRILDENVCLLLGAVPARYRDDVAAEVNTYFARLCGVI